MRECLPACMYIQHEHSWYPWRPEEFAIPGTVVTALVSHDVVTGNQTWVLSKINKCF